MIGKVPLGTRARGAYWVLGVIAGLLLFAPTASAAECPNQAFRTGASAELPDCRAYELVSPPDTNGRMLEGILGLNLFDLFPTQLVSPTGESVLYMTDNSALPAPTEATGTFDLYEAKRLAGGWETDRRVTPSGEQAFIPNPGGSTPDHQFAFVNVPTLSSMEGVSSGGTLAENEISDYLAKPDGSFELVGLGSLGSEPSAQGRYISPGGTHVIFSTGGEWCLREGLKCIKRQLEPEAPPNGTAAIYDRGAEGPTHVVSLLPGDKTPVAGENAEYQGASADGSVVAFKIGGSLYARVDNAKTEKATGESSTFAGLSDNGSRLFYISGGNVFRLDTGAEATEQVNSSGDAKIVNVSADGSHVYLISPSQLDGSKGTAGQPNMYVWSGSSPEYVATVAPSDLERTSGESIGFPALTNWTSWAVNADKSGSETGRGPGADSSRTTPDGNVLAFESRAQLTSYENNGHTEIYRYDDLAKGLECVSCGSTGPAVADSRFENLRSLYNPMVVNNLSDDGNRVFFETPEALVERDTDGINDIYEWQAGESGPTVDLISSGKSVTYPSILEEQGYVPKPNTILGITPTGDDVTFVSLEPLVPGAGEGGASAIYDARVGGGFPVPAVPPVCLEEACRPAPTPAPSLLMPQSGSSGTNGNVVPSKPKPHRHRCYGKKHKKQKRCSRQPARVRSRPVPAATAVAAEGRQGPTGSGAGEPPEVIQGGGAGSRGSTLSASEFEGFGIESFKAEASSSEAGRHPDLKTRFVLSHTVISGGFWAVRARVEEVSVRLPPGLIGNPTNYPRCSTGSFVAAGSCPIDSQVGLGGGVLSEHKPGQEFTQPLFNLEPPHPNKEIARLGFYAGIFPVFIDVSVRSSSNYEVVATVHAPPAQFPLIAASATIWGDPADHSHDKFRLTTAEANACPGTACLAPGGERASGLEPTVFLTNPSACQKQEVGLGIRSYQLQGKLFTAQAVLPSTTACEGLPFKPAFTALPTTRKAGAPTGLSTVLKIPQDEDPEHAGTATMREATVTLPEGMTIASGAGDGLAACSAEAVGLGEEVEANCPDASKLGSATIVSPALAEPLHGALYQRTPEPGHLFRLWLVSDDFGLHIKLPGEIKADPQTGQLTATFADLPQVPAEEIDLDVWGGPRAPLKNPDSCGTYATSFSFQPWSQDPAVTGQSQMMIDEGCGTGGFSPQLRTGVTQPVAGAFSPFVLDLTREDGEANLGGVEVTLPKGELAKLAGEPLCPDAAATTGACPAGSKIGSVTVAAGPGPQPLWIPQPGKAPTAVYLAGPYKGAPFSVVTVVPAQAGPFDLGTVAVRAGLQVDPITGQATVKTDPLPQILEGVPIIYRRVHVTIDRPEFSINPTNCEALAATSTLTSTQGAIAHPSDPFQVGNCAALGFKPKLSLKLLGGTRRNSHPSLRSVLTPRPGDANIGGASVILPPSEQIDNAHIENPCTRVQFNAGACPAASILGTAKAYTPLLDQPLEGPVYFRSNGGERLLPDIVADLHGPFHIILVGFVDSVHKKGSEISRIRTRFLGVPDAPVSKFTLRLNGGKKGLLVNNRNLCAHRYRAKLLLAAQNGRRYDTNPALATSCKSKRTGRRR
jgi:hypothetical protein